MPISVNINAGRGASSSTVNASGSIQHIITNEERTAFDMEDTALKRAVATYFGKYPDNVFVCSPTLWGDLYKIYAWHQVQTLYSVVSATIVEVTSEPTIIASKIFENSSSVRATFNCGISQEVSVTAESNWSNSSTIETGQTVSYGISFLGAGVQGETSFSFSQTWGQGGSKTESLTLGATSGVTVELNPGESVEAELTASRGVLTVQIVYQQTLSGGLAVNYNNGYQGHHYWLFDINAIRAAEGYPAAIPAMETIRIAFYSDSKIVLKNPQGQAVTSFAVGPIHA